MAIASREQSEILELAGEIDLYRSPEVKAALEPFISKKIPRILVDLSAVSYIDSSGLAVLIEALQRIQSYGGKFILFGLRETVRGIFDIARLDQIFSITADRAAALAQA